jgi:hypothetical protein
MSSRRLSLEKKEEICGDIIPIPDATEYEMHKRDDLLLAFKRSEILRNFMLEKVFQEAKKSSIKIIQLFDHPIKIDVTDVKEKTSLKNEHQVIFKLNNNTSIKYLLLQVKAIAGRDKESKANSWHIIFVVFDFDKKIVHTVDPNGSPPQNRNHWGFQLHKKLKEYINKLTNKNYTVQELEIQNFNFTIDSDLGREHQILDLNFTESHIAFCSILTFAYIIDIVCGYDENQSIWREYEESNRIVRFFEDLFRGKVPTSLTTRHKMEIILYVRCLMFKLWKKFGTDFFITNPSYRFKVIPKTETRYTDLNNFEIVNIVRTEVERKKTFINKNDLSSRRRSTRVTRSSNRQSRRRRR